MEAISRTVSTREILGRLMFADDLAVVADRPSRAVCIVEGNLWQTWAERKSREDGRALGRAAEKI